MALGLTQYALFRKNLPAETNHVANPLPQGKLATYGIAAAVVLVVVGVLTWVGVITADRLANIVIGISAVAAVAYFALILRDREVQGVERSRIFAFVPLFVCNVVFWSLYQQQFTVVTIYADKRSTGTCSAGRCRCRGCSRSTRSSSSCWPACSPRSGPSWATASRSRRSSSAPAPR